MYSPAGSTPLARLRAADGHVTPYTPRVVIELGNEEPADKGEYAKAALPILSAMRAKLAEIGGPPVAGVRFAIAYTYVFGTGEFAATQARVWHTFFPWKCGSEPTLNGRRRSSTRRRRSPSRWYGISTRGR